MRAEDEPITLKKACRPVCRRRQSVMIERGNPLFAVTEVTSATKKFRENSESEQIRTLLDRQREQILADCQAEIRKHEFQAEYDRLSIQKLNEIIEQLRRDQQLLHEQLLEKTGIFVKRMRKASTEWEN